MGEGGRWEEGKSLLLGHFMKQHLIQQIKLLNHTDVTAVIFFTDRISSNPNTNTEVEVLSFYRKKAQDLFFFSTNV